MHFLHLMPIENLLRHGIILKQLQSTKRLAYSKKLGELEHPILDQPYIPNIESFLGGIEIYDREETLGEELWLLDPNSAHDRRIIIREYIIPDLRYLSYRHRYALLKSLKTTLQDPNFDFASLFQSKPEEHTSLAWEAPEVENPRGFFEDILHIANEIWKDDLAKAEIEDQSTW